MGMNKEFKELPEEYELILRSISLEIRKNAEIVDRLRKFIYDLTPYLSPDNLANLKAILGEKWTFASTATTWKFTTIQRDACITMATNVCVKNMKNKCSKCNKDHHKYDGNPYGNDKTMIGICSAFGGFIFAVVLFLSGHLSVCGVK